MRFCHWALRTTDADGARAFYRKVLGHDRAEIWALHEEALARGARPHWLGRIAVEDVARAAAAFQERGAMQIGPIRPTADGGQAAVLRDPGGAILAVSTPPPADATPSLAPDFYVLNTNDAARAIVNYRELFGWEIKEPQEIPGQGTIHPFGWNAGGPSVGVIVDITGMAGRHPHWLFYFKVDALDSAVATARASGGLVLGPIALPSGERIAVCDDLQGAAFGLLERVQ
jgi:hypothetical protein